MRKSRSIRVGICLNSDVSLTTCNNTDDQVLLRET